MIFIITPQNLKDQSLVDQNVADFYCNQAIKISQDTNLKSLIGENLYKAIIAKIVGNTLTGKYKELVENYIYDYLYYDSTSVIQWLLAVKIRNAGIVRTTDDNVESVANETVDKLEQRYKHIANSYGIGALNFIEKNRDSFPEYRTEDCNEVKQNNPFRPNINI